VMSRAGLLVGWLDILWHDWCKVLHEGETGRRMAYICLHCVDLCALLSAGLCASLIVCQSLFVNELIPYKSC